MPRDGQYSDDLRLGRRISWLVGFPVLISFTFVKIEVANGHHNFGTLHASVVRGSYEWAGGLFAEMPGEAMFVGCRRSAH